MTIKVELELNNNSYHPQAGDCVVAWYGDPLRTINGVCKRFDKGLYVVDDVIDYYEHVHWDMIKYWAPSDKLNSAIVAGIIEGSKA